MRNNEQQRVERMDGRASFLHAACRLLASDGSDCIRHTCTVLRKRENAEAARLCADRASTATRSPDSCGDGRVEQAIAR